MNQVANDLNYYMRDLNLVPSFIYEVIMGLTYLTEVNCKDKRFLKRDFTLEEAIKFKKIDHDFDYQTLCKIKNMQTTLGRALLSIYFKFDLNSVMTFKETLNSKNIIPILKDLSVCPDRLVRMKKIIDLSLLNITQRGLPSQKLSELLITSGEPLSPSEYEQLAIKNRAILGKQQAEYASNQIY
jgi:hypothetical protein